MLAAILRATFLGLKLVLMSAAHYHLLRSWRTRPEEKDESNERACSVAERMLSGNIKAVRFLSYASELLHQEHLRKQIMLGLHEQQNTKNSTNIYM